MIWISILFFSVCTACPRCQCLIWSSGYFPRYRLLYLLLFLNSSFISSPQSSNIAHDYPQNESVHRLLSLSSHASNRNWQVCQRSRLVVKSHHKSVAESFAIKNPLYIENTTAIYGLFISVHYISFSTFTLCVICILNCIYICLQKALYKYVLLLLFIYH